MSNLIEKSQYIFSDDKMKSRLLKQKDNWFVAEYKDHKNDSQWMPWICGSKEFLALSDQEVNMAYPDKRMSK